MKVEQFVMAYRADHSKIKGLLNEGYESLRPVLRINAEIIHDKKSDKYIRVELNTPVASKGKRGWLNLDIWESSKNKIEAFQTDKRAGESAAGAENRKKGTTTVFKTDFFRLEYTGAGIEGGCPSENDNDGCFYIGKNETIFVPAEIISSPKEYCDCEFVWTKFLNNAMEIPIDEILGAYKVTFERAYIS